jgi:hypothetical protein
MPRNLFRRVKTAKGVFLPPGIGDFADAKGGKMTVGLSGAMPAGEPEYQP